MRGKDRDSFEKMWAQPHKRGQWIKEFNADSSLFQADVA